MYLDKASERKVPIKKGLLIQNKKAKLFFGNTESSRTKSIWADANFIVLSKVNNGRTVLVYLLSLNSIYWLFTKEVKELLLDKNTHYASAMP